MISQSFGRKIISHYDALDGGVAFDKIDILIYSNGLPEIIYQRMQCLSFARGQ